MPSDHAVRQERVRHSLLAVKGENPNSTRAHTRGSAICHPFMTIFYQLWATYGLLRRCVSPVMA
ncbi:hypothetical protein AGR1C_Cc70162 [Agrobacterium fabacearum TT111]|nr:hypothetical protein AGR1C_Cc70162 [Agrobacterium fabacearum TT111]